TVHVRWLVHVRRSTPPTRPIPHLKTILAPASAAPKAPRRSCQWFHKWAAGRSTLTPAAWLPAMPTACPCAPDDHPGGRQVRHPAAGPRIPTQTPHTTQWCPPAWTHREKTAG